jgi:hypothetical protein
MEQSIREEEESAARRSAEAEEHRLHVERERERRARDSKWDDWLRQRSALHYILLFKFPRDLSALDAGSTTVDNTGTVSTIDPNLSVDKSDVTDFDVKN